MNLNDIISKLKPLKSDQEIDQIKIDRRADMIRASERLKQRIEDEDLEDQNSWMMKF